ncbi:MAG: dihydroxyacetone kinase subunit L [Actinobacteria bacterium]|nr:dihydroxyacetone kinase subunit L [Actinomycetota bacterium]
MANQKDTLIKVIEAASKKLIAAENELTELDSMGDADCGSGVRRGFEAVNGVVGEFAQLEVGDILKKVGFTLAYTIGGTSGAMLGTGFIETGKSIGDKSNPEIADWIKAADSALEVIKRRGGNTRVGDKTLVDALEPAVIAMKKMLDVLQPAEVSEYSSDALLQVMEAAYMAAREGSDRTIDMIARKGRASYVGERSRGNRDPGSLIVVLIFEAALEVLRSYS